MIPDELKQLVDEYVKQNLEDKLYKILDALQDANNEIEKLKIEIEILKEGGNI